MNDWDGTLTDYVLFLECLIIAIRLRQIRIQCSTVQRLWIHLFLSLSFAAVVGGTYHGFLNHFSAEVSQYIWFMTMALIGIVSCHLWILSYKLFFEGEYFERVKKVVWGAFCVYLIVVIFVSAQFFVSIIFYLPPVLFFTVQSARRYLSSPTNESPRKAFGLFVLAFGIVLIASIGQQVRVAIHREYFDHNATFHLAQMLVFYFLYRGAKILLLQPSLESKS